jgi:CRP-like cAMP-binding protein
MSTVHADSLGHFRDSRLFKELDEAGRAGLLEALAERQATAGEVLMTQGSGNDHLSFLVEGTAVVERCLSGGRVEALVTLTAPSVFGTISFFSPRSPSFGVRAATDVRLLTLTHEAHEILRRKHPGVAEALAVASLRVLSERFDDLERMFTRYIAEHPNDTRKITEWAGFRARLFGEPAL